MSDTPEALWTAKELAAFLGYAESTVTRMAVMEPDRLPPRVAALKRARWVPEVCRQWALEHTRRTAPQRSGRPRSVPA